MSTWLTLIAWMWLLPGAVIDLRLVDPVETPVEGARVVLVSELGTELARGVSDEAGRARVVSALPGRALRVSAPGVPPSWFAVPEGPGEITLHLGLAVDDGITVTAKRVEAPVFEVPQSVSVIGPDEVGRRSVFTLPAALEGVAGVHMQRTDLGGGAPILRGLVGNQVLLLVDGIRLNNSTFRMGPNQYFNTIDLQSADSVEVVRGPASSLYGSDGLGGVVNVVTRRPPGGAGSGRLLTLWDTASPGPQVALEGGRSNGRVGFVGGASFADLGDLVGGSGVGRQAPTGYSRRAVDLKMEADLRRSARLTTAVQLFEARDVPRYDRIVSGKDRVHLFDPQRRALAFVRYVLPVTAGRRVGLETTLSFQETTEGREIEPAGAPILDEELDRVRTWGGGLQGTGLRGPVDWIVGVEAYRDEVRSRRFVTDLETGLGEATPGRFPDGATYASAGLFGELDIDLLPRLGLLVGARYSRFDCDARIVGLEESTSANFDHLTGSAYLSWGLSPEATLAVGVGQAFRAPGLDDAAVFGSFNSGIEVPSPDLEPEELVSYEATLKILKHRLWLSASLYDSHLDGLIRRVPGLWQGSPTLWGEPVFQRRNLRAAEIRGGEIEIHAWPRPRLEVVGAFSATRGWEKRTREPLRRIPPAQGRVSVRRHLGREAWAGVVLDFAGRQDRLSAGDIADTRIPPGGTPGHSVVSLAGGTTGRRWRFDLMLYNLTDEAYRLHGSGLDGPGRSLRIQIARDFELGGGG